MVVKQVSSKGTGSFGGLADYLLDNKNNMEKVQDFDFENCPFENKDTKDNLTYIKSMQDLNQTAKSDKSMHLIVSFHEDEKPTKETLKDIESELLKSLGMENHQRLSVVHNNTNNLHFHIAVNKIAPDTHKLIDPFQSKRKLSTKAFELEEKHNLKKDQIIGADLPKHNIKLKKGSTHEHQNNLHKPVNTKLRRGRLTQSIHDMPKLSEFKLVHDSKRAKMLLHGDALSIVGAKREADNRVRLSSEVSSSVGESTRGKVKDFEIHSGMDSLLTWIKKEAVVDIKEVLSNPKSTLDDLHHILAAFNLEIKLRGNGIVIGDKTRNLYVKGSDVHRDLSKGKLIKRFGEFKTSKITSTPKMKFGKPQNEIWGQYQNLSTNKKTLKKTELHIEKEDRSAAQIKLKRVFDARLDVVNKSFLLSKRDKYVQRQKIFLERKSENNILSKHFAEKRNKIYKDTKQISYKDYLVSLALDGNTEALKTLRQYRDTPQEKEGNILSHPKKKIKHNIFLSLISKLTKRGKAVYELKSGGKITDTGKMLKLSIDKSDEDVLAALDMAISQYGKVIDVGGNKEFKTRVLAVVKKYKVNIIFSDKRMQSIKEAQEKGVPTPKIIESKIER